MTSRRQPPDPPTPEQPPGPSGEARTPPPEEGTLLSRGIGDSAEPVDREDEATSLETERPPGTGEDLGEAGPGRRSRKGRSGRGRLHQAGGPGAAHRRRDFMGLALTWLSGGALAMNLLLVLGIVALLAYYGLSYFWQRPLVEMTTAEGQVYLGEVWDREEMPPNQTATGAAAGGDVAFAERTRLKVGNRDVTGNDFVWVDGPRVVSERLPEDAVLLERLEWGNFYGYPVELRRGGEVLARGREGTWEALLEMLPEKAEEREALEELEDGPIGEVNYALEALRLERRRIALEELPADREAARLAEVEAEEAELESRYRGLADQLFSRRDELALETVVMETGAGRTQEIKVSDIVRAVQPNDLSFGGRVGLYLSRVGEFLFDDPREANTEGGIFPAIFGTVMMVFLMTVFVVPLGVLAALYLREYAKQGLMVRIVRIAVNNLAGVPSIVFGVFGLGFFVYLVGGTIDHLFYPEALPTPTYGTGGILWAALTLALLTVPVVIVAAEEGLAAVPRIVREGSLALGATKFETIWRVVLPAAAPGILTGTILAMARAAGEVAPLMIVGMVKLAPELPIDGNFPFVHLERKFMHLGFHIYDLGFQSPNVEAAKPMVFATAFLLILVVAVMNLAAIALRNHLSRKYAGPSI